jgi:hypothetical protein
MSGALDPNIAVNNFNDLRVMATLELIKSMRSQQPIHTGPKVIRRAIIVEDSPKEHLSQAATDQRLDRARSLA